ncbi:MAG: hypothetical protein CXT67_00320 [Methanobacteriota archaeon]|nr:MAG: hypothetical protein CXT67_00320 [Euryarchaeota archaeon]
MLVEGGIYEWMLSPAQNMRQLFLDFIDIGEDEPQWKRNLEIYDDLLTEVHELQRYKTWMREFAPDVYKMIAGDDE